MEKKDISPQIEVSKCDLKKNNSGLMKSDQLSVDYVRSRIYSIRGVEVMIDADLADMYGVETKQLKRQVKRNIERFPNDFMFELTHEEHESLRRQNGTLERGR